MADLTDWSPSASKSVSEFACIAPSMLVIIASGCLGVCENATLETRSKVAAKTITQKVTRDNKGRWIDCRMTMLLFVLTDNGVAATPHRAAGHPLLVPYTSRASRPRRSDGAPKPLSQPARCVLTEGPRRVSPPRRGNSTHWRISILSLTNYKPDKLAPELSIAGHSMSRRPLGYCSSCLRRLTDDRGVSRALRVALTKKLYARST